MMTKTLLWKFVGQQVETKRTFSQGTYSVCIARYAETQGWKIEIMEASPNAARWL